MEKGINTVLEYSRKKNLLNSQHHYANNILFKQISHFHSDFTQKADLCALSFFFFLRGKPTLQGEPVSACIGEQIWNYPSHLNFHITHRPAMIHCLLKRKGQRDFDAGIKQGSLLSRVNNISNITKHNASKITQRLFMRRFLNCSQFPADDLGAVTG